MADRSASQPAQDEPLDDPHTGDDWVQGRDAHEDAPGSDLPPDLAADSTAFGVPSVPEDDPDVNTDPSSSG
jgi:hypothetical protein